MKHRPPPDGIWFTVRPSPRVHRRDAASAACHASPERRPRAGDRRAARRHHRRPRLHGEEAAAGARYVVAPNGVARIGAGGGKQTGGEAAVVPRHPMAYPCMVRPAGAEAFRVELLTTAAQGEGTRGGGGGRRGRDRDRDAPRRHDDGLGRWILPDAQLRAVAAGGRLAAALRRRATGWRSVLNKRERSSSLLTKFVRSTCVSSDDHQEDGLK